MFVPLLDSQPYHSSVGKILCVGRNYAAHAAELNNPVPDQPILFIKPSSSACELNQPLRIPEGQGAVHHELEIAILVGKNLYQASTQQVQDALVGIGLGLDLTLRDVQSGLKEKGLPWERAKAFDQACPLSPFTSVDRVQDWNNINFELTRNAELQQQGNSSQMLFPILELIAHMSQVFSINEGDIIMTGTPKGVGPLKSGDKLTCSLEDWIQITTDVL